MMEYANDGDGLIGPEPSEPQDQKSLAELFREVFPYYLAMGMTYDEFWRGDPTLVRDYRKARDIRMRQDEWARHRQGQYVFAALMAVDPTPRPELEQHWKEWRLAGGQISQALVRRRNKEWKLYKKANTAPLLLGVAAVATLAVTSLMLIN